MTERVLLAYASKHGTTREVAEAIAEVLCERGLGADVQEAKAVHDLDGYAAVVLGAPFYIGRWHKDARAFLRRLGRSPADLPVAVFALGPLSTKEEEFADVRARLDKTLADVPEIAPVAVEVFGGAVDPSALHFPFSHMDAADVRDWDAIRAFAERLPEALGLRVPAHA